MRYFYRMRNALTYLLICILCSCHSPTKKGNAISKSQSDSIALRQKVTVMKLYQDSIAQSISAKVSSDEFSSTNYNDDPKITPYKIKYDFFTPKDSTLKKPFRISEALKKLFPGHYYHLPIPVNPSQIVTMEAWRCSSCPTHPFVNGYGDSIVFPLQNEENITRVSQTLFYTSAQRKKNAIVAFESTGGLTGLIGCGRFSGAVLSLALFTEEDTVWKLKSFSPALGYFGSSQDLSEIKLLKLGKNCYGCYFEDGVGPGGGPFIYTTYIFGLVNNSFKLLLQDWGSAQANSFANWDAKYRINNTDTACFSDLSIIMKGWYDKRNYDSAQEDGATFPDILKPFLKRIDSLNFTIIDNYQFKNGEYVFTNETVRTTKFGL